MKIGIVGFGYVGKAMFNFFRAHHQCTIYDVNIKTILPVYDLPRETSTSLQYRWTDSRKDWVNECDLAVVCVPTPSNESGGCDTSIVRETIEWIQSPLILLKSTVEIGTTDALKLATGKRIVFSPEYCGESSYWTPYKFHTDIKETPFFIFGGDPKDTSAMVDFFLPVTGPVKIYRQTSARAAEMAKYMENTFYATKIAFCYEFACICEALGVDFNEARELWLLDPRINPMHTAVFKKNSKPFSGKCLPKDLKAAIAASERAGYIPQLLREVLESNDRIERVRST
jgi:UDPglucose 6-dehydrogenase